MDDSRLVAASTQRRNIGMVFATLFSIIVGLVAIYVVGPLWVGSVVSVLTLVFIWTVQKVVGRSRKT